MRPYEVVVIVDSSLEEETIRAAVDGYADFIRTRGGTIGRIDRWGKRRLAYEMRKRTEGYYAVLRADATPAIMEELHRTLSLADNVLRHKVVHLPDEAVRPVVVAAATES